MSAIEQKKYLKKYLSLGKDKAEKKKKKKKAKSNNVVSRLTIIDDNEDTFENAVKEDLLEDEDAPQIVAVIDDRPPSLQVDEKNNRKLWIPIGSNNDNSTESSSLIKKSDIGDLSPPRIKTEKPDKRTSDSDTSPPRRRKGTTSPIMSFKVKTSRWERESVQRSPSKHYTDKKEKQHKKIKSSHSDDDRSPPRKRNGSTPPKITKTLDGKTAGLQDAKQLAVETSLLKQKEDELFNKMSREISGANASTIVRDKKTGRIRNFEEEAARNLEKQKKEEVNKEKYSRWGRGVKQVEDATKRREEELNEMSKPLARYANDEDLERYLKEQEREGDPMLAYIRKKKKKKDVDEGKPMKPEYMGEFMPNRFGIRPGYRWDGVNRSNGYEVKWFEVQNSRMAQQEEAYKWSTEDM